MALAVLVVLLYPSALLARGKPAAKGDSGSNRSNAGLDKEGTGGVLIAPDGPGLKIRDLARGHGACLATKQITDAGKRVGYMYREHPDYLEDSGWRFFSGDESDVYLDDPLNTGVYDVNTIANFDPEIVPLLDSPPGSAFGRDAKTGRFDPEERESPEAETETEARRRKERLVGKSFPVVSGRVQLTDDWSLTLPNPLNRRVEGADLVLWRRDFTIWGSVWSGAPEGELDKLADAFLRRRDPGSFDPRTDSQDGRVMASYRLEEARESQVVHALYATIFVQGGHLQLAIYFDRLEDESEARDIASSVEFRASAEGAGASWLSDRN